METSCKICGGQHLTGQCTEAPSIDKDVASMPAAEAPDKLYGDLPAEIAAELEALTPAEAKYCTDLNSRDHSLFDVFPELSSFIDSLDDNLRPLAEEAVEYYREHKSSVGDLGTKIYKLREGYVTYDSLKKQQWLEEIDNNPIFKNIVDKEKRLRDLMDRFVEFVEAKKEAAKAQIKTSEEGKKGVTPEQRARIYQAKAVLPDILLKAQAYEKLGDIGQAARFKAEAQFWQSIIDNEGREEPYTPGLQTSPQRQRL